MALFGCADMRCEAGLIALIALCRLLLLLRQARTGNGNDRVAGLNTKRVRDCADRRLPCSVRGRAVI